MLISFIVVAYNAAPVLTGLFQDLENQDYDHSQMEVLLVDSRSDDDTKKRFESFREKNGGEFQRVCVLDNPGRTLPRGWNVALREARGEAILRVDAHTRIPPDFVRRNAENIEQGEAICGGTVTSILTGESQWQRVLLLAENSPFGGGAAKFRRSTKREYVDTVAFAAYSRQVFETVGGYDERLARTEDNEMHYRMKQAGYRMLLDPKIASWREARSTLPKLLRQKYLNGYWIGLTMGICPRCFSLYHLIPFVFVLAVLATVVIALAGYPLLAILMWSAYALLAVLMTVRAFGKGEGFCAAGLLLPVIFLLFHLWYGAGTLVGLCRVPFWIRRRENRGCPAIQEVKACLLTHGPGHTGKDRCVE